MRSAKIAGLMLLTLTLSISGCKTCPKPKPVQHTVEESDLTTWPKDCTKHDDGNSTCPSKTLSWVYRNMVNLYYDWEGAAKSLEYATEKSDLIIESKNAELEQWYRKWYFTVPLGILIGGTTAATVFLIK